VTSLGDDAQAKRISTAAARCALIGLELHALSTGGFVAHRVRWNYAHWLPNLEAVERWLDHLGAPGACDGSLREPVIHDPASRE